METLVQIGLRVLLFALGSYIVFSVVLSAVRTFVLPRSAPEVITRLTFLSIRKFFNLRAAKADSYEDRDRIMAMFAPIGLLSLPAVWLFLVSIGYTLIYRAIGIDRWLTSFLSSGQLVLTLGAAPDVNLLLTLISFSEAVIGLILVALLIAYLPTMYSAFSKRETAVTMLEVRAGSPPSPVTLIDRFNRLGRMSLLHELWTDWELWFTEVEESHTSLGALPFFRSPQPHRSWITAAGTILDSAAIYLSACDLPDDAQAALCIRAGYICLRNIATFFGIRFDPNPKPDDAISVLRLEFDEACDALKAVGIPMKADREKAWQDFSGWRVNYDTVLLGLASLIMAPYAQWISDRSLRTMAPRVVDSEKVVALKTIG